MPKLNAAYAQRLVMDENVQYLLLALYWFFSSPITGKCVCESYRNGKLDSLLQ